MGTRGRSCAHFTARWSAMPRSAPSDIRLLILSGCRQTIFQQSFASGSVESRHTSDRLQLWKSLVLQTQAFRCDKSCFLRRCEYETVSTRGVVDARGKKIPDLAG